MDAFEAFVLIGSMILSAIGGWVYAHETVATECDRLGSFYVGDKVYHCTRVVSAKEAK